MCYRYMGSPEPEPKTLFDRVLDWGEPVVLITPAVAAVALVAATSAFDPVAWLLTAGVIYAVLLLPVGLATCFVMLAVAALCAAIQATWSALRR